MQRPGNATAHRTPNSAGMARVFFALWPDEYCANRLCTIASDLAARHGGRPTQPETLHLTLAFVGNVSGESLPDLLEIASVVAKEIGRRTPPLDHGFLQLDRLAYWKHNRILWAGSVHCPLLLETLAGLLDEKLRAGGYAIPARKFTPHVTLIRKLKTLPQESGPDVLQDAPLQWRYRDFVLLRSRTSELGPAYERLGSWSLASQNIPDAR